MPDTQAVLLWQTLDYDERVSHVLQIWGGELFLTDDTSYIVQLPQSAAIIKATLSNRQKLQSIVVNWVLRLLTERTDEQIYFLNSLE